MDISYKWLRRYIDFDMDARRLAAVLTSLGLECDTVEEVESVRGGLRGLVTGRVLSCVDHPDSDHLHITQVDLGGEAPVQIVCGAPNVAAGQSVIVAPVGTVLYDGDKEFKIKKSKMRGVESLGMICAEDEIGLGSAHDGIIVLPDAPAPGTPAADYYRLDSDWRLEVELTPNRVDAASHYGVARDLKAWMWREAAGDGLTAPDTAALPGVQLPDVSAFRPDRPDGAATVSVEDTQGCPRYSGVTVRGVKVADSPAWLQELLVAAGQRPINNIVDITNFVLLGLGQPLHCFDLDKVRDSHITVRTCPEGTPFTTLDGVEHRLDASDMMICDAEGPLAMAGVFGGLDSGVTGSTTSVFIESAYFNPTRVRRTARRHGLSTDASFRYERGTDPAITPYAARLAALLIRELAGGEICGEPVDVCGDIPQPAVMDFSLDYCNRLIGKKIPAELIKNILRALEIEILAEEGDTLRLRVPAYRVDVYRPCDVVEEILRVYGYNNVEFGTEMHANLSQKGLTDLSNTLQQLVSERLTGQGFSEIMNNSLTAASYYEDNADWPAESCVRLLNPLSGDLGVMRRTLLYGGLESLAHNINRRNGDLRFYEFGKVYGYDPQADAEAGKPLARYEEHMELALWMTGSDPAASWDTQAAPASVFRLKAVVLNLLAELGIPSAGICMTQDSDGDLGARLLIADRQGRELGRLGIVRRSTLRRFGIEQEVLYASLRWDTLVRMSSKASVTFAPLPKTQAVRRDLALLLDKATDFAAVEQTVRRSDRKLLRDVRLFDVYEGDKLPEGKKSYAISIELQDNEKTLTDKQIDAVMAKVTANLRRELGAELR